MTSLEAAWSKTSKEKKKRKESKCLEIFDITIKKFINLKESQNYTNYTECMPKTFFVRVKRAEKLKKLTDSSSIPLTTSKYHLTMLLTRLVTMERYKFSLKTED